MYDEALASSNAEVQSSSRVDSAPIVSGCARYRRGWAELESRHVPVPHTRHASLTTGVPLATGVKRNIVSTQLQE